VPLSLVDCQAVTRPSELVVAVKEVGEERLERLGERSERVTRMSGAGRPETVSRTWHVMNGRAGADMLSVNVWVWSCFGAIWTDDRARSLLLLSGFVATSSDGNTDGPTSDKRPSTLAMFI
jgi:hypothetical protein